MITLFFAGFRVVLAAKHVVWAIGTISGSSLRRTIVLDRDGITADRVRGSVSCRSDRRCARAGQTSSIKRLGEIITGDKGAFSLPVRTEARVGLGNKARTCEKNVMPWTRFFLPAKESCGRQLRRWSQQEQHRGA